MFKENPPDLNGRIELSCKDNQMVSGVFEPPNPSNGLLTLTSAFRINCTNGTHSEVN